MYLIKISIFVYNTKKMFKKSYNIGISWEIEKYIYKLTLNDFDKNQT